MAFGASTDYFGLTVQSYGGSTFGNFAKVTASSKVPTASSRANALDEKGDIVASTFYGNADNTAEVSTTYTFTKLASGGLNALRPIAYLGYGGSVNGVPTIRESLELTFSNSDYPTLTITGRHNAGVDINEYSALLMGYRFYAMPASTAEILINGPIAKPLCFTVTHGRLTSCTLSSSINLESGTDGLGEVFKYHMTAGEGTISAEFVRTGPAPVWAVTGGLGLTETEQPSLDEGQAAYHTSAAVASFTTTRF